MPLDSFPFTGCVAGHSPVPLHSTHAAASAGAGASTVAVAVGGAGGRGTGGNGNGAVSHWIPVSRRGRRACSTRQIANAAPTMSPSPSDRLRALRIAEFSHARRPDDEGRFDPSTESWQNDRTYGEGPAHRPAAAGPPPYLGASTH